MGNQLIDKHCPFCQKYNFFSKQNLKRHQLVCKLNPDKTNQFICANCSTCFSRRDNLVKHIRKCSHVVTKKKKTIPCLYKDCHVNFFTKTNLIIHLSTVHKKNIEETKTLVFDNQAAFLEWKEKEEEATFSYFSRALGSQKCGNDTRNYYYCQHDGADRFHVKKGQIGRKTSRKVGIGKIKNNFNCISKIIEIIAEDGVKRKALYYPTHNHIPCMQDVRHQPMRKSTSDLINYQISFNVGATEILQSIQGNVDRDSREQDTITKNVVISKAAIQQRILKRKKNRRLHPDDNVSVSMMVDLLKKEAYNPIVLFQPTEEKGDNIFMLGIMTESQKKLLLNGSKKILIVGNTHSVKYKNMGLLNVLISDENNKGWPVAHLIANSMTTGIVKTFFKELKMKIEKEGDSLGINCVITDDDPALINGIQEAMESTIPHILCQWHLDKNLKKELRTKCSETQFNEIYTDIKTIIQSSSTLQFDALVSEFMKKYEVSAKAVVQYITSVYLPRKEKWALCYRQFLEHGNINTTAHVESFDNRLKKVYFNRISNKRMDDLLHILLTVEKDDYARRARSTRVVPSKFDLSKSHVDGLLLPDNVIVQIMENLWSIKSLDSIKEYYIQQLIPSCFQDMCFEKCCCPSCDNLCSHLYLCSCPADISLCKHIHKLHSFIQRDIDIYQDDTYEQGNDDEPVQFFSMSLVQVDPALDSSRVISEDNSYQKLEKDLLNLLQMTKDRTIPTSLLPSVTTEVRDIFKKCSLLAASQTKDQMFPWKWRI